MIKFRVNFKDGYCEFLDPKEAEEHCGKVDGQIEKVIMEIEEKQVPAFKCHDAIFTNPEDAEAEKIRLLNESGITCNVVTFYETVKIESETIDVKFKGVKYESIMDA